MMMFTYPALLEDGDEEDAVVVTFPDIPEAITNGRGRADALEQASDALGLALLIYVKEGRELPRARARAGSTSVSVEVDVAAKLAVLDAFRESGLSKSELSRRLGRDEKEVRRILDPMHPTKLPMLRAALAALGRRLVIGVEEIPTAA